MRGFLGPTTLFHEWQVGNLFGRSEAPGSQAYSKFLCRVRNGLHGICLMIEDTVALS